MSYAKVDCSYLNAVAKRLIGDLNKLSLSRFRKGVPEGDAWVSVFRSAPARASGLSGGGGSDGGGAAVVVCLGCALLSGRTL